MVQADNMFQAAKRFAPKTPKRRLQLRAADGSLQTHEEEFRQIVQHFTRLYAGPEASPPILSEALCHHGGRALRCLRSLKASQGHAAS